MALPAVDPAQLAAALTHLEQASAAAQQFTDRAKQHAGAAAILQWKREVGTGPAAIVVAQHVLDTSFEYRALFHACGVLAAATFHCLTESLISVATAWKLRNWMATFTLTHAHATAELRFIPRMMCGILSAVTRAGWALPPGSSARRGWTAEQRQDIVQQALALLATNVDDIAAAPRLKIGLELVSSLASDFSLVDEAGLKHRTTDAPKLLWSECTLAARDFDASLLPIFLSASLTILDGAAAGTTPIQVHAIGKAVKTLDSLLAWRSEDPSIEDPSLAIDFDAGLFHEGRLISANDPRPRSPTSSRTFAASCHHLLARPLLDVLHRAYTTLWRETWSTHQQSLSDGFVEESMILLESCIESLVTFTTARQHETSWKASLFEFIRALLHVVESAGKEWQYQSSTATIAYGSRLHFLARCANTLITTLPLSTLLELRAATDPSSPLINSFLSEVVQVVAVSASKTMADIGRLGPLPEELDDLEAIDVKAAEVLEETSVTLVHLTDTCQAEVSNQSHSSHRSTVLSTFVNLQNVNAAVSINFISSKLDSCRTRSYIADSLDSEEDQDIRLGLNDVMTAKDLLLSLARLSRTAAGPVLDYLVGIAQQLCECLIGLVHNPNHPLPPFLAAAEVIDHEKALHAVCEAVHWATLIVGSIFADEGEGETPVLPLELAELCNTPSVTVDSRQSLVHIPKMLFNLLASLTLDPSDPAMLRCSPQVNESLLWFVGRWSVTYLLADSESTGPMPEFLNNEFGGQSGLHQLDYLLKLVTKNVLQWSAEESVLKQIASTIATMSRSSSLAKSIVGLDTFGNFIKVILKQSDTLPENIVGPLICSTLKCISTSYSTSAGGHYFQSIITAVEERKSNIMTHLRTNSNQKDATVLARICSTLDMYVGIGESLQPSTSTQTLELLCHLLPDIKHIYFTFDGHTALESIAWKVYVTISSALSQGFIPAQTATLNVIADELHSLFNIFMMRYGGFSREKGGVSEQELRDQLLQISQILVSLSDASMDDTRVATQFVQANCLGLGIVIGTVSNCLEWLSIPDFASSVLSGISRSCSVFMPLWNDTLWNQTQSSAMTDSLLALLGNAISKSSTQTVLQAIEVISRISERFIGPSILIGQCLGIVVDHVLIQIFKSLFFEPLTKSLASPFFECIQRILLSKHSAETIHLLISTTTFSNQVIEADVLVKCQEAMMLICQVLTSESSVERRGLGLNTFKLSREASEKSTSIVQEVRRFVAA